MDYQAFYKDVADWITQTNHMAMQHSMNDLYFWNWVSQSIGELCNKYDNNPLVKRQMIMLFDWLEDIYNA